MSTNSTTNLNTIPEDFKEKHSKELEDRWNRHVQQMLNESGKITKEKVYKIISGYLNLNMLTNTGKPITVVDEWDIKNLATEITNKLLNDEF